MFKELAPYLRQRAVLLTVSHIEEDQLRVNIVPQKLKDGENAALTTPMSVTGTAEDLDRDLPSAIVDFVASHLQLKNTLDRAKAEMDAAGKAAQAEARAKAKTPAKNESSKTDASKPATITKPVETAKPEPPKTAGLFDAPAPVASLPAATTDRDEEEDILAEVEEGEQMDEDEGLDEAA